VVLEPSQFDDPEFIELTYFEGTERATFALERGDDRFEDVEGPIGCNQSAASGLDGGGRRRATGDADLSSGRIGEEPGMGTVARILSATAALAVVALIGASCGLSDDTDAGATTAESSPPSSAGDESVLAGADGEEPASETTSSARGDEPGDDPAEASDVGDENGAAGAEPSSTTMPVADDPCATPASHVFGAAPTQYTFTLAGEDRAVGVRVGGEAALTGDATVWVLLHSSSLAWDAVLWMADNVFVPMVGAPETQVVVSPQANGAPPEPGFWTETATFNTDYLVTLFEHLDRSLCLERSRVALVGLNQGSLAAAQGICEAELPVDLVVMYAGLTKIADCDPPRAVPILSYDSFEFDPVNGPHWDGRFPGGTPVETELTGGIEATPDDLAFWADLYNCTAGPTERTLPDEPDLLARDSVLLTYDGCDAPLMAIGMMDALYETDPAITGPVDAAAAEVVRSVFGL
jgi:hypothetical protein